jgi:hypothetical protein
MRRGREHDQIAVGTLREHSRAASGRAAAVRRRLPPGEATRGSPLVCCSRPRTMWPLRRVRLRRGLASRRPHQATAQLAERATVGAVARLGDAPRCARRANRRQRPPHQLLEGRTLTFHLAAEPRTTRPRGQGTALTSAAGRLAGRSSSTRETRGRTSPRTLVSQESRRVLGRRRSTPVWQIRRGRGGRRASRRGATSRVDSIFHTAAITV